VRLEVGGALRRSVRVVPVLVGGASLPAAAELPEELKGLDQRQAVVLHDETWHQDVEGLVRSLRGEPAVSARRSHRWLVAAAVAVVLAVVGVAVWWWGPGNGDGSGDGASTEAAAELAACAPAAGAGWSPIALNKNPTGEETVTGGSLRFTVKDAPWRAREGKWQVLLATSMENATSEYQYHGGLALQLPGRRPTGVQDDVLFAHAQPGEPQDGRRRADRLRGPMQASGVYPAHR